MNINIVLSDRLLLWKVISLYIPITEFLESDWKYQRCPFHDDENPSAVLHVNDDDGIERLYCYSPECNRQYTSYDYIKKVIKQDPFYFLRSRFSDEELELILSVVRVNKDKRVNHKLGRVKLSLDFLKEDNFNLVKFLNLVYKGAKIGGFKYYRFLPENLKSQLSREQIKRIDVLFINDYVLYDYRDGFLFLEKEDQKVKINREGVEV